MAHLVDRVVVGPFGEIRVAPVVAHLRMDEVRAGGRELRSEQIGERLQHLGVSLHQPPPPGSVCRALRASTPVPITPASTDPARMPIFASSSAPRVNERSAMKSDTVKPIPASAATPVSWRNDDPSGSRLRPSATHTKLAATIPTVLPATSPVATPQVIELDAAALTASPPSTIPALARTNTGTTRKLVHGCRRCSSASITRRPRASATGVSRPSATPAIVACTPDWKTHNQSTRAGATYAGAKRTPSRCSSTMQAIVTAAPPSHATCMSVE